jgi:hypothetical protein
MHLDCIAASRIFAKTGSADRTAAIRYARARPRLVRLLREATVRLLPPDGGVVPRDLAC